MTVFDTATDTLFADPNIGVEATYTPLNAPAILIRAILTSDVQALSIDPYVSEVRTLIDVRKSEVTTVRRGDTVTLTGQVYTVDGVDPLSDAWVTRLRVLP